MVPLRTNRRVLTWYCVYPAEEGTSMRMKLAYILLPIAVPAINVLASGISLYSFFHLVHTDLEASLFCLLQVLGESSILYIVVVIIFYRREITEIVDNLTKIYEKRKSSTLFLFKEYVIKDNFCQLSYKS